jgi:hypothetical protein
MTDSVTATIRGRVRADVVGALGLLALGVTAGMVHRSRSDARRQKPGDKRAALAAYLRDHLAGADAAIQVVGHLKDAQQGRPDGTLFASLHEQLQEIVMSL